MLDRLREEFPVLVLLPTPTPEEPTAGIGSTLEETINSLVDLGFETDSVPSEGQQPLLETATQVFQPGEPPATPPEELSWYEAPTPDREIRHLARRIRKRLATDESCSRDDLLVLAPGLLSYREGIADIFEAYGIDHTYRVSILLERTYAGRAVLDAIQLCEQPRSDQLGRLLTNPLVDIATVEAAEVSDVQRRLYTSAIEPFLEEIEESDPGLETFLEQVEAVRTATPEEIVPTFESLLDQLGIDAAIESLHTSATIDGGYERKALFRVEQILASVHNVCEQLEPDEPLTELATALEGVRIPPPQRVTDDHVEIIGLQDAPMAEFDELYVLGATAEHLSGTESRPRYFQAIGETLGLFKRYRQRDRDRYRFGMVLANAKRVHITTPEKTIADDPLLVSPFVDELARVTGLEPTSGLDSEQRGCREDLQRAMAGADPPTLEASLDTAQSQGHVPDAFASAALRGASCGAGRASEILGEHDGQLTAGAIEQLDDRLTKTPYSHSRLTRYAKCGFKYLLRVGWNFEQPDDIGPGVSPLVVGKLIHESVEDFYRGFQSQSGEPVDLTRFDRDELEERLLVAGFDALDRADETFDDVFSHATMQRVFAGLGTPDSNPYYGPIDRPAGEPVEGTFRQFLDTELERAEEGFRPTHFEASFGGADGISQADRTLPVGGIVDRIDTSGDGDGVTVFDYKSSSVAGVRRRENQARDGIDFQLPLYLLGTPSLFDDRPALSLTEIDALYYVINDGPTVKPRRSLGDRFDDIDMGRFLETVVPDRIEQVVTGIESGAFQPAIVGPGAAHCDYCEFSDACDVRHHRRYDVIEHIDRAGKPAYVPDGARPGDTTDRLPGGDTDG